MHFVALNQLWANKTRSIFFCTPFHIFILKAESVAVSVVSVPKKFHIENFRWENDLRKKSIFHEFPFRFGKKVRRPAADSILMPPTFHIASLNRYTPNFSGVPQKLTWCQQFGLQIFPKLGGRLHASWLEQLQRCPFYWNHMVFVNEMYSLLFASTKAALQM